MQRVDVAAVAFSRSIVVDVLNTLLEGLAILPSVRTVREHILMDELSLLDVEGDVGNAVAAIRNRQFAIILLKEGLVGMIGDAFVLVAGADNAVDIAAGGVAERDVTRSQPSLLSEMYS